MSIPEPMIPMEIDPCAQYGDYGEAGCKEWAGLIPYWAAEARQLGVDTAQNALDYMAGRYGFPVSVDDTGEVREEDWFHYPGDPPMAPLVVCHISDAVRVIVYPYGLLSVVDGDTQLHTRMD